jgi:fatty acid desaturase
VAHDTDPVLKNARREAVAIAAIWLAATAYCCIACGLFGYPRPGRPLEVADIHPVFGMPSWVFWGIMVPWAVCAVFTFWFAGRVMVDDDLGKDHTPKLEDDIRERGLHG